MKSRRWLYIPAISVFMLLGVFGAEWAAGQVVLYTDKESYEPGEPVAITIYNGSSGAIWIGCDPPYEIYDALGDTLVYPHIPWLMLYRIGPDSSFWRNWSQQDYHGDQVLDGIYIALVQYGWLPYDMSYGVVTEFCIGFPSARYRTSWGRLKALYR